MAVAGTVVCLVVAEAVYALEVLPALAGRTYHDMRDQGGIVC